MSTNTRWKRFANLDDEIAPRRKTECDKICEAIAPFFTAEAWAKWVDAGPDGNAEFEQYALEEWARIRNEFSVTNQTNAAYMAAPDPELASDAEWLATGGAYMQGPQLPPAKSWNDAMMESERNFNRRYYNNPDGKPEWRYNG